MANNTSRLEDLMTAIATAITTRITTASYAWDSRTKWFGTTNYILSSLTSGKVKKTWLPFASLEPEHTNMVTTGPGTIWIVGLASGLTEKMTRKFTSLMEFEVTIGYQELLGDVRDFDAVADRVTLTEQLNDTCRLEVYGVDPSFVWIRQQYQTDENGTPFSYVGMRDNSVYESYVTHTYQHIVK